MRALLRPGYHSCPGPGLDSWLSELSSSTMQHHYNQRTAGTSGGWHWQINVRRSAFISSRNYIQTGCQNSQKRIRRETRRLKFLQKKKKLDRLSYTLSVRGQTGGSAHAQARWYLNVDSMPSTCVLRHSVSISSHSSKHIAWDQRASSLPALNDTTVHRQYNLSASWEKRSNSCNSSVHQKSVIIFDRDVKISG